MSSKFLLPFAIATLLASGSPIVEIAQAQEAIQVAQSAWQPFNAPEGDFTVLMPGTPEPIVKQTIDLPVGQVKVTLYGVQRVNEAGYLVGYSDFPAAAIQGYQDVDTLFDSYIAGFAQSAGGSVISQEDVNLNNYPGREFKLQLNGDVTTRGRIYLVDNRLYQLAVVTPQEQNLTETIEEFFSSFQLSSENR